MNTVKVMYSCGHVGNVVIGDYRDSTPEIYWKCALSKVECPKCWKETTETPYLEEIVANASKTYQEARKDNPPTLTRPDTNEAPSPQIDPETGIKLATLEGTPQQVERASSIRQGIIRQIEELPLGATKDGVLSGLGRIRSSLFYILWKRNNEPLDNFGKGRK